MIFLEKSCVRIVVASLSTKAEASHSQLLKILTNRNWFYTERRWNLVKCLEKYVATLANKNGQ